MKHSRSRASQTMGRDPNWGCEM